MGLAYTASVSKRGPTFIEPFSILQTTTTARAYNYGQFTDSLRRSLEGVVGTGNISTSLAVRENHGKDESYHSCLPADAVVFPGSVGEVREVARLCNAERVPMVPFGTGTGLEGGVGAVEVRKGGRQGEEGGRGGME